MHFVTVEEAQRRLPELLDALLPGETLHITRDNQTVADVVKQAPPCRDPRKPGNARGKIIMADDFDAPLEEFKDYMP